MPETRLTRRQMLAAAAALVVGANALPKPAAEPRGTWGHALRAEPRPEGIVMVNDWGTPGIYWDRGRPGYEGSSAGAARAFERARQRAAESAT